MDNQLLLEIILVISLIWLTGLTYLFFRRSSKWGRIEKEGKSLNLTQILEGVLGKQAKHEESISKVVEALNKLDQTKKSFFQKSAFVRFNPFEDTGGDQSFIVAFLDGNNNGFVISSLHSRNGTRVYAKQVESGEQSKHQLSKEEKEVVDKAARQS